VAEGKVDVVVHQIDQLVGEDQFALQFRVLRRDPREERGNVHPPEGDRGTDPEQAAGRISQVAHGDLGTGHGIEGAQGVLVKDLAGGRQRQLAGRAFEQPDAEFTLKIGDLLADLRPGTIQAARRRSHAAGFDDPDETFPTAEPVHLSIIR
jgi:hypothetical protein